MLSEILKHQSLININSKFVTFIKNKYNNKINMAQYIFERLSHSHIHIGYSHKTSCPTILTHIAETNENFDIVLNNYEEAAAYSALTYSTINKKPGVIITDCKDEYKNLSVPLYKAFVKKQPILLLSLFESEDKDKKQYEGIKNFVKEKYIVQNTTRFPHLLEYMLLISQLHTNGPVQLHIDTLLLTNKIDLDDMEYMPKEPCERNILNEKMYYQKLYELIDIH